MPPRSLLLLAGMWWAFRTRKGRALIALWGIFLAVAVVFEFVEAPPVQRLFALTFPWGQKLRMGSVQVVLAGWLVGAGSVAAARWLASLRHRWPRLLGAEHPTAWRRIVVGCAILALLLAEASAVTIYKTLTLVSDNVMTYSPDAAAAMGWLRKNAQPGERLANDRSADAGLWAPFKAGVPVLASGSLAGELFVDHKLILDNVTRLDQAPQAASRACDYGVQYTLPRRQRNYPGAAQLPRAV